MKKKTGAIIAIAGAGIGFLVGKAVEQVSAIKSMTDYIDKTHGSDDLEYYLFNEYGVSHFTSPEDSEENFDEDKDPTDEDKEDFL